MSFIEVKVADWNCEKATIGIPPKGGEPTILYDGKMPILVLQGDSEKKYIADSFKGLQRSRVFDEATKKYTDEWDGEWNISFRICDTVATASPLQKKLMLIFDDLVEKFKDTFEKPPAFDPISYKWNMIKNKAGVEKKDSIKQDESAYLKAKVGYTAPNGCEMFTYKKKEVPVFQARTPSAKFYDITRARGQMLIPNADLECKVSMQATPKILLQVRNVSGNYHFTRKLMQCYYEPTTMGGGGEDEDIINSLVTVSSGMIEE